MTDIDQYLAFAAEHGLTIKHVLLTHLHADFIAGHLELRDRVGDTVYLGAVAEAEYRFTALHDGDRVEFGGVRLQALETPGHTPESISIQVFDLDRQATEPYAVMTGDTLFVGDVGRPDLRASLGARCQRDIYYASAFGELPNRGWHTSRRKTGR
jgi:glyoxylase-like metal-dependent hydrolase (beta-lactamase superfamily II)